MIKDVAFIAYAVRDVPRSVAFYRDVVGLPLGKVFNDAYVEFNVGSTAFAVDGDPPGTEPGTCSGLAFEVNDIDDARSRLVSHGATVSQVKVIIYVPRFNEDYNLYGFDSRWFHC